MPVISMFMPNRNDTMTMVEDQPATRWLSSLSHSATT